ncbi:uncharacterized protein LOC110266143 isoform X1 [Arachis ipaensis]|uniref:uncharacterized protein n=1 Tax=Arachis hypogaea TaxID=3818 RepID=UPI000A2B3DDC|nr:uncharacterized protein LOC110266143 isoform X1 [Arachis ipaensis]
MASSSHFHHHNHFENTNNFAEQEKEHNSQRHVQQEEEENWLTLGLGLGRNDDVINTSSFNNQVVHHHHGSNNNPQVLLCSDSSSSHIGSHGEHHHHQQQQMLKLGLGLGFQQDSMLLGSSNNDHDDENGSSCQIDSTCGGGGGDGDSHDYNKCGLWFTLRSSTNRRGEALPQIPKAYIRIRDENMTVFMVKKYLVTKLGLSNEAEIDILCMGESLSQIQTLKQVREAVWIPRLVESLDSTTFSLGDSNHNNNDDYMSLNHIMSLLYRKHCFLN